MLIKIKKDSDLSENNVTDEVVYLNRPRRQFLQKAAALSFGLPFLNPLDSTASTDATLQFRKTSFEVKESDRPLTAEKLALSYNNFYEFSLDKEGVSKNVEKWKVQTPWTVEVSGIKGGKKTFDVDQLIKMAGGLEERIYRFRCVEAWSMVLPWVGFSLAELIKKLEPDSSAQYVYFETFSDKKIGANMSLLPQYPWPYTEGLTMKEATHPLTLIATGLYGKSLPKQNGAPLRLVVPWKYGFKNIKSIVKISFVKDRPKGLWEKLNPDEYGFYANVNPKKDHPRWSQASERVINGSFFPKKIPTLMFNGYEKDVADLYKGLDLAKNY